MVGEAVVGGEVLVGDGEVVVLEGGGEGFVGGAEAVVGGEDQDRARGMTAGGGDLRAAKVGKLQSVVWDWASCWSAAGEVPESGA